MIKKLLILALIALVSTTCYASQFTENYRFEIPAIGARNWQPIISNDLVSMDTTLGVISRDLSDTNTVVDIISRDMLSQDIVVAIGDGPDWISMTHNQTDAVIDSSKGRIKMLDDIILDTSLGADRVQWNVGASTNAWIRRYADGIHIAPTFRNVLITSRGVDADYSHAESTNPTLFIHSDIGQATSTEQWMSFTHDQTDGVITTGTGGVRVVGAISPDSIRVSADSVGTLGGQVGRIEIISQDGSKCYIPVYAGS